VVGVDGWTGGWVAAAVVEKRLSWSVHTTITDVLSAYPSALIGVDMPIGLPQAGYRDCDLAARDYLGPARSSIFLTPTRAKAALWHPTAAHPIGENISRQMWNLLPKVAEIDAIMTPRLQLQVAEVHPECSFRTLTGETLDSKKTGRGVGQRLEALAGWIELPALRDAPPRVPLDDLLDAAIVAWTAQRWRDRPEELIRFGSPARDERDLLMSIVA
jgi:predicted RNase H-like nuclease